MNIPWLKMIYHQLTNPIFPFWLYWEGLALPYKSLLGLYFGYWVASPKHMAALSIIVCTTQSVLTQTHPGLNASLYLVGTLLLTASELNVSPVPTFILMSLYYDRDPLLGIMLDYLILYSFVRYHYLQNLQENIFSITCYMAGALTCTMLFLDGIYPLEIGILTIISLITGRLYCTTSNHVAFCFYAVCTLITKGCLMLGSWCYPTEEVAESEPNAWLLNLTIIPMKFLRY